MEAEGEQTWVTLADGFVAASFLMLVVGVFAAPIADTASALMAAKLLGMAMILFAASPLVLAGHYNLYCKWGKGDERPWATKQEVSIAVASLLLFGAGAWWILG